MDSDSSSLKVDKLNDSNYHAWKQKIQLLLALRDVDDVLDGSVPDEKNSESYKAWARRDKKAQACIGLTLSDSMLENVRDCKTASEMWKSILDVFEKHTLLNKLAARRQFYTAKMLESENVLTFANRIRQLASTLKSMKVTIDDEEMAMALLNGLPERYDSLISALDALGDEKTFTFEFVKSRLLQEEQRTQQRIEASLQKSEESALLSTQCGSNCPGCNSKNIRKCTKCGKTGHTVDQCWELHPHLKVDYEKRRRKRAFIARHRESNHYEPSDAFCLMANDSVSSKNNDSSFWYIDSGATTHMSNNRSNFSSLVQISPIKVELGNRSIVTAIGKGTVTMRLTVNNRIITCSFENVLYIPKLGFQLISVSAIDKLGYVTQFGQKRVMISKNGRIVATGSLSKANLYVLDTTPTNIHPEKALTVSLQTWHHRLAHVNPAGIKQMIDQNVVKGAKISPGTFDVKTCTGCVLGKGHRDSFPKSSESRSSRVLELVHSDIVGPLETPSIGGSRYFITFIDDFSKWTVIFTMRKKSEALECFKKYHNQAEIHAGQKLKKFKIHTYSMTKSLPNDLSDIFKLKTLRSDNGGEYISTAFSDYLDDHGIQHQLSVPYTPQQNGVAERMNRTLMNHTRSILLSKNVNKEFWAEALSTAVYIRNRVTTRSLPLNVTPYHLWNGEAPNISHLRIFGAKCWYVIPKSKVKKLDARSREAMMVGYALNSKGYKLWDADKGKFIISRDVTFDESIASPKSESLKPKISSDSEYDTDTDKSDDEVSQHKDSSSTSEEEEKSDDLDTTSNETHEKSDHIIPHLRRSTRIKRQPHRFEPGNVNMYAKRQISDNNAIALIAHDPDVPKSYKEAISPDLVHLWKTAIEREHTCLLDNHTWTLTERKPGMHVLPSKYVFKMKTTGPKARVVAVGFRQVHGVDYMETYAPVVNIITVRMFFAVIVQMDLELEQMDVVTAFLYGDLDEDIFMEVPEGLRDSKQPNLVCRLLKSIYGLKQAPRQWYAKVHSFLVEKLGFKSSRNDPCLYILHSSSEFIMIALYVDDLLIAGSNKASVVRIKGEFKDRFKMKDMGEASEVLGIEIKRNRANRTLFLHQESYTNKVLERFGMTDCRPVSTPVEPSRRSEPTADFSEPAMNVPYRHAVGSIMYLMIGTRPDLAFAIRKLSQHLEQPLQVHWIAVKRVLRYIAGTRDHGILFRGNKDLDLIGYSDSDWAGCRESRKSTSGFVFMLAGGAISWRSKKQTIVALSTCEAEYVAASLACKEAIWLSRLLADMLLHGEAKCIELRNDNSGAIATAKNSGINQRNKHIDLKYHFVRDCHEQKRVYLVKWPTADQVADICTKALDRVKFEHHRNGMGIVPNH